MWGTFVLEIISQKISLNRPSESDFRAFQNLVSEHSIEGTPASLYNLTKSAPDPLAS